VAWSGTDSLASAILMSMWGGLGAIKGRLISHDQLDQLSASILAY
jgi:hypothetical protein